MGKKQRKNKKKKRLRKLLTACDPEIGVLSLLIVQAQVGKFPYCGGEIKKFYAAEPDKLIAQADLPADVEKAWKRGQWKAVSRHLVTRTESQEDEPPTELPTGRGWPP